MLPSWMRDALCQEVGPDLFFDTGATHIAVKVCTMCPVSSECLEYGNKEEFGVWGGTTAYQRRKKKREKPSKPSDRTVDQSGCPDCGDAECLMCSTA